MVGGRRGYVLEEINIKANLVPAGAGTWAELGNMNKYLAKLSPTVIGGDIQNNGRK